MRLTRKAEYAIRSVLYMSSKKPKTKIMAKEISKNMGIPRQFLAQVMLSLSRNGYVRAIRGAKGGFILAKRPSSINLLNVIEDIEGKLFLNECLISSDLCKCQPVCPVSDYWGDAQKALLKELKKATFSSMVKKGRGKRKFTTQLSNSEACCKKIYTS